MERTFIDSFRHYQTYHNWFLDFNPLSKLNLLFALGFATMVAASWEFGLPLCVLYCVLAFCSGKGKSFLKPFGVVVLIFGFFTLVIRQFSVEGSTVLFRLFGVLPVTQEALINGLDTASYLLGFSGGGYPVFCDDADAGSDVFSGEKGYVPRSILYCAGIFPDDYRFEEKYGSDHGISEGKRD